MRHRAAAGMWYWPGTVPEGPSGRVGEGPPRRWPAGTPATSHSSASSTTQATSCPTRPRSSTTSSQDGGLTTIVVISPPRTLTEVGYRKGTGVATVFAARPRGAWWLGGRGAVMIATLDGVVNAALRGPLAWRGAGDRGRSRAGCPAGPTAGRGRHPGPGRARQAWAAGSAGSPLVTAARATRQTSVRGHRRAHRPSLGTACLDDAAAALRALTSTRTTSTPCS
jgi:hypothetical protein